MSHTIHRNKAFVLGTSPYGEANMYVDLLTKELGFLRASAQGIRFLKSKLRYSVTPFSIIDVSLVKGKEVWRLVGALKIFDGFFDLPEEKREVFFKLSWIIRRLVQGEDSHSDLFELFQNVGNFMLEEELSAYDIDALLHISTLRLLSILGYVEKKEEYSWYLQDLAFTRELFVDFQKVKKLIISSTNQALTASGL